MIKTLISTLLLVITGCGPKQLDVTRSAILSALPEGAIGRLGPTSEQTHPSKALIGLQKQVAVTFSSDERFVSASDIEPLSGSSVHLWSLKTDQAWSTGIDQKVSGFIISEHTERVAVSFPYTGDIDPHFANHGYGRVIFYDLNSWRQLDTVGEYYEAHTAFSNDENQLLMAGTHHEWHLYDLEQNRIIARSHPLGRPTSRQSTHLQEGSPSADIWFPYETSYLERRRSQISSVGFDPHHQMFVFGGLADCEPNKHCDWVIWLDPEHGWDEYPRHGWDEKLPRTHCDVAPVVTPYGVVWCGKAGLLMFVPFPIEPNNIIDLRGGPGDVQDAAISKDGCLLATGFEDGTIALFDLSSGQRVKSWSDGHNAPAVDMDFSPSGHHLAAVDQDGVLLVWETAQYLPKEGAACLPKPPKEAQE